uniref:Uncharacterized protein n=1 Tax=Euplotes crassus TaxID=5936 RepID=A0A7S3NVG7_EUPCR
MSKLKTAIQSKHSKIIKENESMESCSLSLVTSEFEDEDSMSTKKVRKKTYKPRDFGKNKYTVIQRGNKIKKTSSILMTVLPQDKTYHPFESLSRNYNPEAQTVSVTKMKRMKHKLTKYFKKRLRSQEKPEKSEQISSKIKLVKSKKGFRRRSIEPNIQSKIKKSLHYLPKTPYSAFLRNNKASLPEIHSLFTAKEQEVIRSNKKVSRYMRKFFGQGSSSKPKLAERKPQKETSETRTDEKFLATSSLAKQRITSDL